MSTPSVADFFEKMTGPAPPPPPAAPVVININNNITINNNYAAPAPAESSRPRRAAAEAGERKRQAAGDGEQPKKKKKRKRGKKKTKKKETKKETAAEKKAREKRAAQNKARNEATAKRTREAVAAAMEKYADDDSVLVQSVTGGTMFIDKDLKKQIWKYYSWKSTKLPRVANGRLTIGKCGHFGTFFSKFVISKMSEADQAKAEAIGFVVNGSKGAVAEHDTNLKTSFTKEDVHKLVLGTTNVKFRVEKSTTKAKKTSLYPGVKWHSQTKKWQVGITDPASKLTPKKEVCPSFNPDQKDVSCRFKSETDARDAALTLLDFLHKDEDFAAHRAYVEIYNARGEFAPVLRVEEKLSTLLEAMRPDVDWD